MVRVVIPDDAPSIVALSAAYARLSAFDTRVYPDRPVSEDDLIQRIRDAEAVINVRASTQFTRAVLQKSPRLRLISIWGTGTDNVDLAAARELGICVTNTPGVAAVAVAEHILALILAAARNIVPVDRQVRAGNWPGGRSFQVFGKTLGLIGTGAIGREVARLGKGIGCRVIAWTFHPGDADFEWAGFDDIFRMSDIVSVHVRQSPETVRLIRRQHFDLMKPGALFINTARGAVVDEAALVEALSTHKIGGAGLDVFEKEPLPPESPLLGLSNVVLTSHCAGNTPETTETGIALAIDNIFQFFDGQSRNVVVGC